MGTIYCTTVPPLHGLAGFSPTPAAYETLNDKSTSLGCSVQPMRSANARWIIVSCGIIQIIVTSLLSCPIAVILHVPKG